MSRQRADLRGSMGVAACAGALAAVLLAAALLFGLVFTRGARTFWPAPLESWQLADGTELLVQVRDELDDGSIRAGTGNRELQGQLDFVAIPPAAIVARTRPTGAVWIERQENGPFHGWLLEVRRPGTAPGGEEAVPAFLEGAAALRDRTERLQDQVSVAANAGNDDAAARLSAELGGAYAELDDWELLVRAPGGAEHVVEGRDALRVQWRNRMHFPGRLAGWFGNLWRFVVSEPREANTAGGVWPALVGTSLLVILMSILVVPFGVLAAVYLNEYARDSVFVRLVRIAVNNLAGVPSIVYGVFGLGFLIYGVGGALDDVLFPAAVAAGRPVLGAGNVLWASVTMALLTVPVVIVATEEGLRACPREWRESALALGSTKWESLRTVILPAARPGIITGLILAVSRAAGEVAPLMLTGVVGHARELPIDGMAPFLHLDRRFMHLGFHIYSVGFQSPNVEAAEPLVYATAALLLMLVLFLNLMAIRMRSRARRALEGR